MCSVGKNTPGTREGPGGRYRTLAVKRKEKTPEKIIFKKYFFLHLLVMPKYWRKQILSLGSLPEVDQKRRQVEVCTIFLHTEEHDENHLDGFPRSGLKSSEV